MFHSNISLLEAFPLSKISQSVQPKWYFHSAAIHIHLKYNIDPSEKRMDHRQLPHEMLSMGWEKERWQHSENRLHLGANHLLMRLFVLSEPTWAKFSIYLSVSISIYIYLCWSISLSIYLYEYTYKFTYAVDPWAMHGLGMLSPTQLKIWI